MIRRIYIDNFRCFTAFEYEPESVSLILGKNGVGKTSLLHVVQKIQAILIHGSAVNEQFHVGSLTRWDARPVQTFEMEIEGNGGVYCYRLEIEHERSKQKCRIAKEELLFDKQRLYLFDGKEANLFRDDPNWNEGPKIPYDWTRSFISSVPERQDNQKLVWFRQRVSQIYCYGIDPIRIESHSNKEVENPSFAMSDLVSWLRHLSQDSVETMPQILASLKEVFGGLANFKLEKSSDTVRTLKFLFEYEGVDQVNNSESSFALTMENLSEGQRCLVALFSILHAAVKPDCTLFIDEPDNFVALEEIQPWLVELNEKAHDSGCQLGLVSHHPSVANFLASNHGLLIFRDNGGPARCKPFEWDVETEDSPAEAIARGVE